MDETIIITGAFGALGRAMVRKADERGFAVTAVDRGAITPFDVAERLAGKGEAFPGTDLTDEAHTLAVFSEIKERFGPLRGLINIAGGFRFEPIAGGAGETFGRLYDMNCKTALNASKAALDGLIANNGAIVNIGAYAALQGKAGIGAYAVSKSAVHRLTEALADEVKGTGVRVNAVLPSIIDTPLNRAEMPDADTSKWVTPDQLANVILFLLSPEAAAITGALIPVTGCF
jgi:NAD(P)-dependent dehydrogenase (short-subunit alcohol dehydrogenase family)